jgi:4-hydroxybutyrate dehydrogenase
MNLQTFSFPTPTLFGPGALAELPSRCKSLGMKRPLVVTDAGLAKTSAFKALAKVLGESRQGEEWFLFQDVQSNPGEDDARNAGRKLVENNCDGVIAIGGGSPLDVGKAARLLQKRPNLDFTRFYEEPDWRHLLPLVAIPTTAGTGSEVGRSSVLTLKATHRKAVIFHPELLAKLVILDPELTVDLPPKLTAATGADALTHCIESFTCPVFHPMCDGIALEGIHLVVDALPRAYKDGKDLDARGKMLVAAAMGAVAFQKDLGVVHSLAHPLSSLCGMHHGLANALCLVAGMKFCSRHKPGIYRRIGLACGLDVVRSSEAEADLRTIEFVRTFLRELGLGGKLGEHGVRPEQIDALAVQAFEDPCHKTNVVPVTQADLKALYLECLS